MKKLRVPDSAGWLFFALVFLLLVYPLYLVMSEVTVESDQATTARITFSIFGSAIVAAVITWLVNLILVQVTLWVQKPASDKHGKGTGNKKRAAKKH